MTRSLDQLYIIKLLYNMGQDFLDTQLYQMLCMIKSKNEAVNPALLFLFRHFSVMHLICLWAFIHYTPVKFEDKKM